MRLVSWNVNGIRACVEKGFKESVLKLDADIVCLQETKVQAGQIELELPQYHMYWNYAQKKGYSGTAIFTKEELIHVAYGLEIQEHDMEGRVITAEFNDFYLINVYTPNSGEELKRLDYRMSWDECFLEYINKLQQSKPVIVCGDLNVAHKEIDLKNPKTNKKNAGFTAEEREKFEDLLRKGQMVDTFRYFYPDLVGSYSWWSYRFQSRAKNAGWRIDYFLVSDCLKEKLMDASIHNEIFGSDHCPVELLIG